MLMSLSHKETKQQQQKLQLKQERTKKYNFKIFCLVMFLRKNERPNCTLWGLKKSMQFCKDYWSLVR